MSSNQVSNLLEILDLDYLKPIMIDRYQTLHDLSCVDLNDIGVRNPDDLMKLRYALNKLQGNEKDLHQLDPILSLDDSARIVTRINNEIDLITSSLQLLLNDNYQNLPRDDATSDIDYRWCQNNINEIERSVEQVQIDTNRLIEKLESRTDQIEEDKAVQTKNSYLPWKGAHVWISFAVLSLVLITYVKKGNV